MAIQFRRGTGADLDISKLLTGEPAYTTDSKRLYIANGDGSVRETMFIDNYAAGTGVTNANKVDHAIYSDSSGSATNTLSGKTLSTLDSLITAGGYADTGAQSLSVQNYTYNWTGTYTGQIREIAIGKSIKFWGWGNISGIGNAGNLLITLPTNYTPNDQYWWEFIVWNGTASPQRPSTKYYLVNDKASRTCRVFDASGNIIGISAMAFYIKGEYFIS